MELLFNNLGHYICGAGSWEHDNYFDLEEMDNADIFSRRRSFVSAKKVDFYITLHELIIHSLLPSVSLQPTQTKAHKLKTTVEKRIFKQELIVVFHRDHPIIRDLHTCRSRPSNVNPGGSASLNIIKGLQLDKHHLVCIHTPEFTKMQVRESQQLQYCFS